ncbi:CAP domain-containing protein [Bacillus sp. REN3]|uniref:CAP domain-containing protein n=1 Tax=Bacillus sp. REN3 TaxID=2802440 RepID=UPI001FEF7550|nr:CAP domain-containing protein [Bacillus sp. REN3]
MIFAVIFLVIGLYFGYSKENVDELVIEKESEPKVDESLERPSNGVPNEGIKQPEKGLGSLIGKDIESLKAIMGEPSRVDLSGFHFHWWVFNDNLDQYVQAGVLGGKVVTAYGVGENLNTEPFKIGQPIEEIFSLNVIEPDITFEYKGSSYKFELSEEDMNTRPLIRMGNYFAQLYIDRYTGALSSIRFLDKETLIKQRPYEMVYRGKLVEPPELTEQEWSRIEEGTEKQILDITNIFRMRHGLGMLQWDEQTAEAAFAHSKDMAEEKYFSHESETNGSLSDRLKAADVGYELAGENIAANYTDAPAVAEGWLNSESHRETMLNDKFTHIGVGVYQKHYTQNFLKKWETK